ncbi:histidine kinase dimerization/phospho-acceptor domain-containing protein [Thiolapillus sp.]|uniref:histidine kinase dimerization/phospho-acceptor domain-containing protein n=1 Tax=Thiolapillus sp. TaxID=2017437 RepID=UPI0025DC958A|nr:histidine kinase dimerization/phospho-acceptor domain-containing protein [Thiolapillus sp.]
MPQPSWSPSTTQQLRKLVAAPYLSPNDWTPRLDAYFASPLALCARRVSSAASRLLGSTSLRFALHGWQRVYVWFASADGLVKIGQPMPGYGAGKGAGLQTLRYDSHEWRVAAVQNKTAEHFLYVAQRDDLRTYLVHEIGGKLLQKELLSIPVIVLVLWLGIRRGLRPLSRLNAQIARRKPGNLQPVSVENIPGEIAPLVESINRLLKRLQSSLESERSFTANAAHELRNPLAVVRNVAHILTRTDSMEEVHVSGRILDKSAERMGELLSQLLHLARLDALTQADLQEPVVLRTLLEDVVAELVPEADAQGIQLAYSCSVSAKQSALLHLFERRFPG